MTEDDDPGMTARRALDAHWDEWIKLRYFEAFPRKNKPNPQVPKSERDAANKAASDALVEMLGPVKPPSHPVNVREIAGGRLPPHEGGSPIFAGLLWGDFSFLRVTVQGAWALKERDGVLFDREEGEEVEDRFIVTCENGDTCRLKVTLKVEKKTIRQGTREKVMKSAVFVDNAIEPWATDEDPDEKLARIQDGLRKVDEGDAFEERSAARFLVEGKPHGNPPAVRLTSEDLENIVFDIEDNMAVDRSREFHELRFWPSDGTLQTKVREDVATSTDITRRAQRKQKTQEMYQHWFELAQELKKENSYNRTELARAISRKLGGSVNSASIKRRLDHNYPGWADSDSN